MCRQADVKHAVGGWVQFRTPWGTHRGIVEQVNSRGVLMKVPKEYAPVSLAFGNNGRQTDEQKLDAALAFGGYGGAYGAAPGYGPRPGVGVGPGGGVGPGCGPRWGYPGYGAWGGGWWFWWLAFAWIIFFAFLWW